MSPIVASGDDWMAVPRYPDGCRLDRIAPTLDDDTRKKIAVESCNVILDMLGKGYAHRDFHCKNLFWVDNRQLVVVDFEWAVAYEPGRTPRFAECYDMTGKGLESPPGTGNMCYAANYPSSLEQVLKVSGTEIVSLLEANLKDQMREVTYTFHTVKGRRTCDLGRIYASFDSPYLRVSRDEAQRDTEERCRQFGLTDDVLRGRSVLDLGSNIGAMLLEIQKHGPGPCLGIEYDKDKVRLASRIAAYNGLNNVVFRAGDLEKCGAPDIGRHDVVFCLAILAHMKQPERLFWLLSEVTSKVLYFEGNAPQETEYIRSKLTESGFTNVTYLGFCTDDHLDSNNHRPVFRAERSN
ncbi:MAG TPA: methyltransferase domain-containing protein [Thermoguttaceae bacterium]|nr:methyltransferase domain-containing protein [Thermoguttaceae bacterium]